MTPVKPVRAPSDGVRTSDGRTPGRRGRATRAKLLKSTADLLQRTSYRDLTVMDIARRAGTSPATFYQYFPDVEAAILVLAREMADQGAALSSLIRTSSWKGNAGFKTASAFVDRFFGLWEEHRALLRVVDLATLEGDLRFQNIRTHLLNQVTEAFRDVVEGFSAQHPADLDPIAQAATIVSLLAHVASHRYGFEFWGIRMKGVRQSVTRTIYWSVTGRQPPA